VSHIALALVAQDAVPVVSAVSEPLNGLGPAVVLVNITVFLKNPYGLQLLVAPAGHNVSVPVPASLLNP